MSEDPRITAKQDKPVHKPIMFLGRDLLEIKCFRDSFICGICTSVAGGLGTFLFTSKTLFSTHVAFASLWVGVFAYWIPCRYKYENELILVEKIQKGVARRIEDTFTPRK